MPTSEQDGRSSAPAHFGETRWSVVLRAGRTLSPDSATALEDLCAAYWYPLYAFVRRTGRGEHDAQDLTQEFFYQLLDKRTIRQANPARGRFRSFLIASMKNFLVNEWDRTQAQKRGGGHIHFSLDAATAEERYLHEPAHFATPEKLYEQRWAQTVLEQVMVRLREEFAAGEKRERFDELKQFLVQEPNASSYREAGARLGLTEKAIKSAVFRLRQRYGEIFRAEISETVADPLEVDQEIRYLFAALAG